MTFTVASLIIAYYAPTVIQAYGSGYSTAASFKTAMEGQSAVVKLATPVTYTLIAEQISLLPGINNIWSDCGNTTIEYFTEDFADLAEEIGFAEGGDY